MEYKVVDCNSDNTIYNTKKWVEFTDEVKDSLERQIPKKAVIEDADGTMKYNILENFCSSCGQAIEQTYTKEDYQRWGIDTE